jgi:hypothetical protein
VDALDVARLKPVDPHQLLRDLVLKYGLPKDAVRIVPEPRTLVIEIGPFPSPERAQAFAKEHRLDTINLLMSAPFRWLKVVEK